MIESNDPDEHSLLVSEINKVPLQVHTNLDLAKVNYKPISKIRRECLEFFGWRFKWLFAICIFFLAVLFLVPSKHAVWILLNITGFFYVQNITCNREILRDEGQRKELLKLLIAAPILYWFGAHWALIDGSDGLKNIIILDKIEQVIEKPIVIEGLWMYVLYTFTCYVIPFFIGLHFTYLDYFPFLQSIVISKEELQTLSIKHWIFLTFSTLIVLFLIAYHVYLLYYYQRLLIYGICGISLIILFIIQSCVFIRKYKLKLHIHHYQIGGLLYLCCPFQNVISSICQGLTAGVYVEGIGRWGMSSSFKK